MKKYFEKYELFITILIIIGYVVSNMICIQNFGDISYILVAVNVCITIFLSIFIVKNKMCKKYGLVKVNNSKKMLYFIPLFFIVLTNLIGGIKLENSFDIVFTYIINMFFVGFIEEVIFRGFLYKAIEKDGKKDAEIISSLTFGIGHIINLLNGASLIPTLIQIICAIIIGYLFVKIFQKTKSLWPCIIAHSSINMLSIFSVENNISTYLASLILIIISCTYLMHIMKIED